MISMDSFNNSVSVSSSQSQLTVFCREVRNLLRSKPNCMIPFSKFVPAYHNHYGRQCCVYQFGYTKLIELLESIPHVVRIVGDGTNRYITLTHREQIKRFASDLIKVVKAQSGKRLRLSEFPQAYEQVLGRTFRVEDYGTRNINVLLAEIWEGTINIIPIKRRSSQSAASSSSSSAHSSLFSNASSSLPSTLQPPFISAKSSANSKTVISAQKQKHQHLPHQLSPPPQKQPKTTTTYASAATKTSSGIFVKDDTTNAGSTLAANDYQNYTTSASDLLCGPYKPYITAEYPDAWFEIPKRERSDKEIRRTKYFVADVIELLSTMAPHYSVPFSKFIPAYHYYFNTQCKVSVFGFSKLIDLFESISPHVVEIIDMGSSEEKVIRLAERHIDKVIDRGPSAEEVAELEKELEAYESLLRGSSSRKGDGKLAMSKRRRHTNHSQHHHNGMRGFSEESFGDEDDDEDDDDDDDEEDNDDDAFVEDDLKQNRMAANFAAA